MIRPLLSGEKRSFYGKGEIIVYRLHRDHQVPQGESPILGVSVTLIAWGDAFWPTYTRGDNAGLIATDSMKNFVQREALTYPGFSLTGLAFFLADKFMRIYPQVEGAELHIEEVPFERLSGVGFRPSGGPRRSARLWLDRENGAPALRDVRSGLGGYELLRLGGSAFHGFVRDAYTTLPETHNRPLRMKLAAEWTFAEPQRAAQGHDAAREVHRLIEATFEDFTSGSIQQLLYQTGRQILLGLPQLERLDLEGQNHTWEAVTGAEEPLATFTVSKPFYGILGLSLTRADLNGA